MSNHHIVLNFVSFLRVSRCFTTRVVARNHSGTRVEVSPEQLIVVGCEELPGFGSAVKEGRRHDPPTARACIEKAVPCDTQGILLGFHTQ